TPQPELRGGGLLLRPATSLLISMDSMETSWPVVSAEGEKQEVFEAAPKLWDLRTTEGALTKGGKRGRHREQNERIELFKRGSVLSDSAGCMLPPQLDVLFCARERK
ncbi:hypothetical protein IRJ41_018897, partial [Triplophysa rosa]